MLFNLETSAKLCAPVINVPMIRRFTDTVALCFVSKQSAFSFWGWNHTMIHNFPHRFSWSQVITWVVFHMVAWIQCWSLQLNAKRANSQICTTCFCFDFYSSSNWKWQLAWLIWWETMLFLAAMLCSLYTTSYTSVVHQVTFADRDPNLLMLLFNLFNCFIRIFLKSRLWAKLR